MPQPLTPYALADWQRAVDFLGASTSDQAKLVVNEATARLEQLAGMALRERSFRDPVTIPSCSTVGTGSTTLNGPGAANGFSTKGIRALDVIFGSGVQTSPQATVSQVVSETQISMSENATAIVGPVSITFGNGRLKASGSGSSTLMVPMRPIRAVYGASWVDSTGTTQTIDISGAILGDDGSIILPNDSFPQGRLNIALDIVCGWPFDGGADLKYQTEWQLLESFCFELARIYYEKLKVGTGQADYDLGNVRVTAKDVKIPEHIVNGMLPFTEFWP